MFALVDVNNDGELPNTEMTRIEQIPYLVMRIGQILVDIRPHLKNQNLIPFYSFSVRAEYRDTINAMIRSMESEGLPRGASFYEVDERKVFEMRGPSGGVATSIIFYLVAK